MIGRLASATIALAVVLLAWGLQADTAQQAQAAQYYGTSGDLFYNYYVPPAGCGGVPAQLYLSPGPTPPVVGHTYVTYQPLMPHEFLYPHARKYWQYDGSTGNWTRTKVVWQRSWLDSNLLTRPPKPMLPVRTMIPLLGNP